VLVSARIASSRCQKANGPQEDMTTTYRKKLIEITPPLNPIFDDVGQ
jgi:hypothetical protein